MNELSSNNQLAENELDKDDDDVDCDERDCGSVRGWREQKNKKAKKVRKVVWPVVCGFD